MLLACGSSWRLREGERLALGCASRAYWTDADGDGWGDPDLPPQDLCAPDVDLGLTATVGLDCDDGDPEVTGRIGSLCPADLAEGVPAGLLGVEWGGQEYAAVWGPEVATSDAVVVGAACAAWGGEPAVFAAAADVVTVTSRLAASVGGGRLFAGWLGVSWEGDLLDGAWTFGASGDDALLGADELPWCGSVPAPTDAWPELNPADADHLAAMEEELPGLRLALSLDAIGQVCLGLPPAAGDGVSDAAYGTWDAHPLCGRPRPDPAAWAPITQ
jgi:hypothetical protein